MSNVKILEMIKEKIPEFTDSQRNVADYILKNPTESAFLTIDQLAKVAKTSTSTVVRLVSSLDFDGYSKFQKELQKILRHQSSPKDKFKVNLQEFDEDSLLIRNADTQINNIKQTVTHLDDQLLEKTINEINAAKRVYCFGLRTSYSAAHYLANGLNRLLGNCEQLELGVGDLPEKLSTLSSSDLVIAINLPRYTRKTVELVGTAKRRNAIIISITDGYSSPMASYSDIILPCEFNSVSFHNSIIGSLFIADYLISAIAAQNPEKTERRLMDLEALLDGWDTHIM